MGCSGGVVEVPLEKTSEGGPSADCCKCSLSWAGCGHGSAEQGCGVILVSLRPGD